jgi:TPR repeat protein
MGMEAMEVGDYAEAYCLWRPLAMRGHTEAAFHLGWLFANGNGLRVNVPKAVYWWVQAAGRGHSDAMFALALAYTNGEGIRQDEEEAMRWYLKAADQGHEDAREMIKIKVRTQSSEVMPHLRRLLTEEWLGWSVEIKAKVVNLRLGPGTSHRVLAKAKQGDRLVAVQKMGHWIQVIDPEDERFGWVAGWLVEKLSVTPIHRSLN